MRLAEATNNGDPGRRRIRKVGVQGTARECAEENKAGQLRRRDFRLRHCPGGQEVLLRAAAVHGAVAGRARQASLGNCCALANTRLFAAVVSAARSTLST